MSREMDLETRETLDFVSSHLQKDGLQILEVGCGNGLLARALMDRGHRVTALDADEEAVAETRQRGVPAERITWPQFHGDTYDAILFTRSLHHIDPLDHALVCAFDHLKPEGMLLVEDFDFPGIDETVAAWFWHLLNLAEPLGVLDLERDTFGLNVFQGDGGLQPWQQDHGHHLHSGPDMITAIGSHFQMVSMQHAPYLYRYLRQMTLETEAGRNFTRQVLNWEKQFVEKRPNLLIGRRMAAKKSL